MNRTSVQVVNYHNSLGECLRAAGRYEDAVVHFEQALAINPDYINAKFNLGLTYQSLNEIDRSIVLYAQVSGLIVAYHGLIVKKKNVKY
jgi:tetratricopeptide (TPR) repeat protein